MKKKYFYKNIEKKVQYFWDKNKTFEVHKNIKKKKYYCLSMFPYPSGKLHIGHLRNYTIGDVISRYHRMLGYNVLQPIGWDAFGLPAETEALKNNMTPDIWTKKNISFMKKQLKSLGFSYDWSREIKTCDPNYYKWEQKFFIKLYNKGLAYKKMSPVNWCKYDKTVLANEQVINNCCWRCGNKIIKKNISQWFIKITKYADQLLNDLKYLNKWPSKVKNMQKKWIGKSIGIKIIFNIKNLIKDKIKIYTNSPEMIMGITYITISINHKLSIKESKKNKKIYSFIKEQKFYLNSIKHNYKKKNVGIFSGLYAIHPISKKLLPIWIINFISSEIKEESFICVPAHNSKDLKFAKKYNIKIKKIFKTKKIINNSKSYTKEILYNSGEFDGLTRKVANKKIIKKIIDLKLGKIFTSFRLKDWNISRQRYWGTPIPIVFLKKNKMVPVKNNKLPILLPKIKYLNKNILNPIKQCIDWINTSYNGKKATRETDTFDTFLESSWYLHRYTSPNFNGIIDSKKVNYWLPVDKYIGGIEHATMHLLYVRFYHKLLRDEGFLNTNEPIKNLICQGMVLSDTYYYINKKKERVWVNFKNVSYIKRKNGKIIYGKDLKNNKLVYYGMKKMSKSKKNGVDPKDMIKKYGADTMRLFIMFAAPVEMNLEWKESGVKGSNRFIHKLWKIVYKHIKNKKNNKKIKINKFNENYINIKYMLNKTILKVTEDIKKNSFNTAISTVMKFIKFLKKVPKVFEGKYEIFQESLSATIKILYPFIPHVCFILWKYLGYTENIDYSNWPIVDYNYLVKNYMTIIVQINGKFKRIIKVPINYNQKLIEKKILNKKFKKKYILDNIIKKTIYINKKVINFVLKKN